ncbi:MAG: hypothetical protein BGO51_25600 [Rhodospirillales bacterium 69-11]|nr:hypothetical protein [Rhodospirillales bacterium]MBN8926950.1 hypothetical protein [Rhodospirillales bacterium]OJW28247.1 MAG: hypothetical protein BGO51_25600 [Rhodospirillales bacterium 69-11]
MLRLAELALFLLPFALFLAWRLALPRGPSRAMVLAAAAALLVLAATLFWLSGEDTLAPGATYVPPHMKDGVIVPGHGAKP